jgi:hypothetical protein
MALDSHTYGFSLQELSWPFDASAAGDVATSMATAVPPDEYPDLAAMTAGVSADPDAFGLDFEFGLDLILDGLERLQAHDGGRQ